MSETDLLNVYIKNILNEVSELTKKKLLLETEKEVLSAQVNAQVEHINALEAEVKQLKSKKKIDS